MTEVRQWVTDTSVYTHLCRAGHVDLLRALAPGGVVIVPDDVHTEIERGRAGYPSILSVNSVDWARLAVLDDDEVMTQLQVKAQMGGFGNEHMGECAVIACAVHRDMIALMDERAAIAQAKQFGVATRNTLWIVVEAYKNIFNRDRGWAIRVVDDLIETGMYLPVKSGESLMSWAYEAGLLP